MTCSQVLAGGMLPAIFLTFCLGAEQQPSKTPRKPREPLGLVPVVWPKDNPYTPEKAELGRYLYFDPRLSADGTVSCGTCHNPHFAFTDGAPNLDAKIKPLHLTNQEKKDLVSFLTALSGEGWQTIKPPEKFPQ